MRCTTSNATTNVSTIAFTCVLPMEPFVFVIGVDS
jgi:hypothetical protein